MIKKRYKCTFIAENRLCDSIKIKSSQSFDLRALVHQESEFRNLEIQLDLRVCKKIRKIEFCRIYLKSRYFNRFFQKLPEDYPKNHAIFSNKSIISSSSSGKYSI